MRGPISRRDFLNGSALLIASSLTPLMQLRAAPERYYPPALKGLRGSHVGSFEVAHLSTPFEEYESQIVDQLDRMLGPGGFSAARDIAAITVNRWPHGYAYAADSLFDADALPPPYEVGRKRCGSVTIANSDAGWNAYTHEAIDQAWRAVTELKSA